MQYTWRRVKASISRISVCTGFTIRTMIPMLVVSSRDVLFGEITHTLLHAFSLKSVFPNQVDTTKMTDVDLVEHVYFCLQFFPEFLRFISIRYAKRKLKENELGP